MLPGLPPLGFDVGWYFFKKKFFLFFCSAFLALVITGLVNYDPGSKCF